MGELKSGLNLVFRELPEGHRVYWMGFQACWLKGPWGTNIIVKESWNAYLVVTSFKNMMLTEEEGWSIIPRQINDQESSNESMILDLSLFSCSTWTFMSCNPLSQPFRERLYGSSSSSLSCVSATGPCLPAGTSHSQENVLCRMGFRQDEPHSFLTQLGHCEQMLLEEEGWHDN